MGPGVVLVSGVLLVVVLARRAPALATLIVCAVGALHAHGVIALPESAAIAGAQQRVEAAQQRMEAVQERSIARLSCRHAAVHATDADDPLLVRSC